MATESEQELVKMNGRLRKILDGSKDEEHAYGVFEVLERLEVDATIINVSNALSLLNICCCLELSHCHHNQWFAQKDIGW